MKTTPHSRSISSWLVMPVMAVMPVMLALALSVSGIAAAPAWRRAGRRTPSAAGAWTHRRRARGKARQRKPAIHPVSLGRRDPFAPLLADQQKPGREVVRPPGLAGLMIGEIDVQGTVRGPRGAVAVVSSPDGHVYFLRRGDRLFDGSVEKIHLNRVVFVEHTRDAFGRAFNRRVTKAVQSPQGVKR